MVAYHQCTRQAALFLGESDRLDAFCAAVGLAVLADLRALAVAVFGHYQQIHVVARDVHRDDPASLADVHAAHPRGVSAHRAGVGLGEPHGKTGLGDHDDLVVRVDGAHRQELVVVADLDGDDSIGFDRCVVGLQIGLLDRSVARGEDDVLRL